MSMYLKRLDITKSKREQPLVCKYVDIVEVVDQNGNPWEPVPGPDPWDDLVKDATLASPPLHLCQLVLLLMVRPVRLLVVIPGTQLIDTAGGHVLLVLVAGLMVLGHLFLMNQQRSPMMYLLLITTIRFSSRPKHGMITKTLCFRSQTTVVLRTLKSTIGNISVTVNDIAYDTEVAPALTILVNDPMPVVVTISGNASHYTWSARNDYPLMIGSQTASTVLTFPRRSRYCYLH